WTAPRDEPAGVRGGGARLRPPAGGCREGDPGEGAAGRGSRPGRPPARPGRRRRRRPVPGRDRAAGNRRGAVGRAGRPAQATPAGLRTPLPIVATIGSPTNGKCPINWTHQRGLIAGGRCSSSAMTTSDITIQTKGPYT